MWNDLTTFSLFDSRLGIMKYINPLRAKILIFAALHDGFSNNSQDWLSLKMVELDSLLRQLLNTCELYTDLEALLYKTAHQLDNSEDAIQTATALIKCLRSFYLHGSPAALIEAPTDETRLSLDEYEENTLEIANASDEDRLTCQLLSPTFQPDSAPHREDTELSKTHLISEPRQTTDQTDNTLLRFDHLGGDDFSNVPSQPPPPSNQGATN
jgi:hypothetical protein